MVKAINEAIEHTRVIGVFAHIDAGKTTTSEAILYYTGRIHRIGSVDEGTTQLDWMEQERTRGITITAAATTCAWRGSRINLIDTPGHIDFTAEVMRSMRVIDGAVIVLCGVGGVETQTETVWRHADRQRLPRVIFINKLDRPVADFERVLADVRERLTRSVAPLQWPIGRGETFAGVVDLLDRKALLWRDAPMSELKHVAHDDERPTMLPIPAEMEAQINAARAALVDAICETDEALLAQRMEGREPEVTALRAALRRATIAGKLAPVVCGSARERIGVQPLLDTIVECLPSPVEAPPVVGFVPDSAELIERPNTPDAPLCASAFKIVADLHVGHLTWVRVFSGGLETGGTVYIPRVDAEERVGRIYQMHANRREQVRQMGPGDVMALVGLKSTITGDTLCDRAHPIAIESFTFPEPVITVALKPVSEQDQNKLRQSVARLCSEDPTLVAGFDAETQEELLSGMGELHLEIAVDRLKTEYGVEARVSLPRVAYRETVRRRAAATGTYRQQTGGRGHFAMVRLWVKPLERGKGIVFENRASAVDLPDQFVRAAEAGAREALGKGAIAGYPVADVRVTWLGGRFHEVDSNSMDFRIAGSMAVRQANPTLIEPIMCADINVGEEHMGAVVADLARRRGSVSNLQVRGSTRNLVGQVPMAEVRGYATDLRNLTQGRCTFTLEFRRYELVPDANAAQIIEQCQVEGKVPRR